MKNRILFGIIAIVGVLISCENKTTLIEQGGNTINLDVALEHTKGITLSQLGDSLECIALETNETSLLGNRAHPVYADDQNIFIYSESILYRYGANGQFLNKIGQLGDAPGQYSSLYPVTVDKTRKRFLFYIGQRRVQYWGYDGVFQKEIRLNVEGVVTAVSLVGNDRIVAEGRKYSDEGLAVNIYYFDLEGNLLREEPMRRDDLKVSRSMHTISHMYSNAGIVKYKDINDDTLFSLNRDEVAKQWILNLGEYKPSREYLEDVSKKETLLREFAQLVDIQESSTCFYFLFIHKHKYWGVVVNKINGQLEYSQTIKSPYSGGGMENDYLKGCSFWPLFIDDSNTMYALLSAENALNCKDIQRYSLGQFQLTEDSNPVVVKVRGR